MSLKELLLSYSENANIQFFRYCILGAITFCVDASLVYILTEFGLNYLYSSGISFTVVLFVHLGISKKAIFTKCKLPLRAEVICYGGIAIIGLIMTEFFMYLFTDLFGIYYMFSKVITTFIVLIWNFAARKLWLYKN
jgi:putative flippase GtrA